MVTYKTISSLTAKADPTTSDLLVIADVADSNNMKKITVGSIITDIGSGLINDTTPSTSTTYSSNKIDTQITAATLDASTTVKGKTMLSVAPAVATSPIAVGSNDPKVPPVSTSTMTVGQVEAMIGTSGTPSSTNKYVTNDDTTATPTASKVVRYDGSGNLPGSKALTDVSQVSGEAITAGQAVFIESVTTFANATSVQNIGDVSGNTRLSFPIFGSGTAATTFKLSLKKTLSPSATFSYRIETDNAGSPSGTTVTNGTGTLAAASITTSFVDTTLTLAGSVTLTAGTRYHLVLFAGTYASETVNATNYFNVGYSTNNTTTRPSKTWNGSAWSAVLATTFCYTSSTLFLDAVLSLTDADFSYKVSMYGLSSETKAVGLYPNINIAGINANQTGLTNGSTYYLSGTPGAISTTAGTNSSQVGAAVSATQVFIAKTPGLSSSNGVTSYNTATASGTQTIAHGLNKIPKYVRFNWIGDVGSGVVSWFGTGAYNATTNSCVYTGIAANGVTITTTSASFCIIFDRSGNGTTLMATAIATFDATNITLNWTRSTSAPTGTLQIMWEAQAYA